VARILVVDDDPRNLRLALAALKQSAHELLQAGGGAEGVELALREKPDLVLMDVQMPGMDGITALGKLREAPAGASLTIVALTALAMKGDRERLLEEGFDGYLEKPIQYKEFLSQIEALLAGRREA